MNIVIKQMNKSFNIQTLKMLSNQHNSNNKKVNKVEDQLFFQIMMQRLKKKIEKNNSYENYEEENLDDIEYLIKNNYQKVNQSA